MGGSKKQTVGYWYYMDIHVWMGHEIEALLELQAGERTFWSGNATSSTSLDIINISLFGGEKREGGLLGIIDFMKGDDAQPVNPGLRDSIRTATGNPSLEIPAFRGVSSLFFRGIKSGVDFSGTPWSNDLTFPPFPLDVAFGAGLVRSSFTWSAMNPYFKAIRARVQNRWDDWYPEKAKIDEQMNPAHIIYRVLTNPSWSSGLPTASINDANFRAAADTLYDEDFGLGFKWEASTTVKEFIQLVLDHINGSLTTNLVTGQFELTLARDDYDVGTIIELNPDNCRVNEVSRRGLADTSNEVVVTYTRPQDGEADTVAVQNTGNIAMQGRIVTTEKNYNGVHNADLAAKLAFRDLQVLSQPLATIALETDRTGINLPPGAVFKLAYPAIGFEQVVFRVASRDLGSLEAGRITIQAVEDVFAAPVIQINAPQPPQWVDTSRPPEPVAVQLTTELPYYILITDTTQAERDEWPAQVGFVQTCALNPNPDASTFTMYDNDANTNLDTSSFSFTGTTVDPIDINTTVFTLHNFNQYYQVTTPEVAYIGEELMLVTALDNNTGQVTVQRAVYDTIPVTHPAETRVFFLGPDSQNFAADPTTRVFNETANLKYLTNTSQGELDPSSAPVVNYAIQNRYDRPYPPANVQVEGEYQPTVPLFGPLNVTWAHRDRELQQDVATGWFDPGDIGPEAGVTYTIEVYNGVTLEYSETGIAGNSAVVEPLTDGLIHIEVSSQRDGFDNWQTYSTQPFEWTSTDPSTTSFFSDDLMTYTGWGRSTGPSGIYDSNTNKTYIAWQFVGAGSNKGIHISAYDHAIEEWSDRYMVGNFGLVNDAHGHPSLCIDSDGFIYCFFGCHNNQLKWSISNVAGDHTGWTQQSNLVGSYTYPSATIVDSTIYLFIRESSDLNNLKAVLKVGTPSSGSVSFGADQLLVDFGSDSRVYRSTVQRIGTDIHFVATRSNAADTERKGVYYFIYETTTGDVRNFDGSSVVDSLNLPVNLTQANNDFKIFDNGSGLGDQPSMAFDTSGNAHVLLIDNEDGPTYFLKHMWLDNSVMPLAWSTPETIAEITDREPSVGYVDTVTCVSGTDGEVEAWFTNQEGQQLRRIRAVSGVWGQEETIIDTVGFNFRSSAVADAHPDIRIIASETIDNPTDSGAENLKLYTYGENNSVQGSIDVTSTDPLYDDVVTLLNCNHRDGSFIPIDASRASLWSTLNGDAQIDNNHLLLDGDGDYVSYEENNEEVDSVNEGDLTIEAFITLASLDKVHSIANKTTGGAMGEYRFNVNASNILNCFAFDDSSVIVAAVTGTTELQMGIEYHVAVSREGTTWRLFLDGSLEASDTESGTPTNNPNALWIGRDHANSARDFDGLIRGFRFTRSARYTSSFTPPTYPLPEQ